MHLCKYENNPDTICTPCWNCHEDLMYYISRTVGHPDILHLLFNEYYSVWSWSREAGQGRAFCDSFINEGQN